MSRGKSPDSTPGFTVVEMLVSVAVLVILVALVLSLFNSATATATLSRKHIDADEAARLVFDRMGSDFAAMSRRADVNYIFCKNGGNQNDAMFFYSESPGYLNSNATFSTTGSASTMALVGYRVSGSNAYYPGIPVMERLGENLTWSGTADATGINPGGMMFLTNPVSLQSTLAGNWTYTLGTAPYQSENDTTHFQVLSDMVFRMEFCFLLKSGTYALSGTSAITGTTGYSNAPTALPTTLSSPYVTSNYFSGGTYPGGSWQEPAGNVYGFPPDLGGVVVTIAVLDSSSRKIVGTGNVASLSAALKDSLAGSVAQGSVQAAPELTSQVWQNQLLQNGFAQTANVPQSALAQVRVYERTFYLDAN